MKKYLLILAALAVWLCGDVAYAQGLPALVAGQDSFNRRRVLRMSDDGLYLQTTPATAGLQYVYVVDAPATSGLRTAIQSAADNAYNSALQAGRSATATEQAATTTAQIAADMASLETVATEINSRLAGPNMEVHLPATQTIAGATVTKQNLPLGGIPASFTSMIALGAYIRDERTVAATASYWEIKNMGGGTVYYSPSLPIYSGGVITGIACLPGETCREYWAGVTVYFITATAQTCPACTMFHQTHVGP